jgi:outer membrane protein TolC
MTNRSPYGRPAVSQTAAVLILCLFFSAWLPAGAMAQAQAPAQAQAQEPAQEQSLPLSPIEQAEKKGTALRISLKDLTKLALQNNLDIAISDTNEEMYRQRVIGSYGRYDPALNVGFGVTSSQSPNTRLDNAARGSNFNQFDRYYWNFSFLQNIPTGGNLQVDWNSGRANTNQSFALFNPQYNASFLIRATQPLWRNRRTDEIRSNIKLVNLDLKINDSQFKQKVTDTIAQIQGLYWDLVAAIRDYEIKRESVKLAQIQLDNNKKKVEIGTLAPIGITEARAEVASREQEMIASEERIFTVQNGLRALISNDRHADIWQQTIVPTESPEFKQTKVLLDQAIDTALQNRPELEQLATRLEKNEVSYGLDLDRKKWQFDLVGSFGSVGVAGPQGYACIERPPGGALPFPPNCVAPDPPGGHPTIDPIFVGGPATAYGLLFTGGFMNWAVGFNVQIPLKNREVESALAQSRIEKRQMLMNRKVVEQTVIVDVRNAIQAMETNEKRVESAKVARDFAEQQLDGETKRFQAGLSENFRVLDRQRQLSVAQGVELQTLIAYKKSVIDLQKAMYTLLEFNDFEIAKTSSEQVPILK